MYNYARSCHQQYDLLCVMLAHLLIAIEVALCGVMTGSRDVLHSTHAITLLCVYYCTVVCFTAALLCVYCRTVCVYCRTVVCLLLHCCVFTAALLCVYCQQNRILSFRPWYVCCDILQCQLRIRTTSLYHIQYMYVAIRFSNCSKC